MPKDKINSWYKSHFDNLNSDPPEQVWENVSAHLDTEKVWESISNKLDRKDKSRKRRIVIAVFFLLIGAAFVVFENTYQVMPSRVSGVNTPDHSRDQTSTIPGHDISTDSAHGIAAIPNTVVSPGSGSALHQIDHVDRTETKNDNVVDVILQDDQKPGTLQSDTTITNSVLSNSLAEEFQRMVSITLQLPVLSRSKPGPPSLDFPPAITDSATPRVGFTSAGISCVGSFSGLVNRQCIRSLKKNTTNSVSIASDISFEISGEKVSSAGFGIGGFFNCNSETEQTYHGYFEGQFRSNVVQLRMIRAGACFEWYWDAKKSGASGPENCFVAGITGNFITHKYYSGIEEEYYNPKNIVTFYPGVMLGVKKYKSIFPGLYVHAAIVAESSITNIYAGEPGTPRDFFRTYVVTTGVAAGITYRFNKP